MGVPINVVRRGSVTEFSLTNSRNESKQSLRILIDSSDYDALVNGVKGWYIYEKGGRKNSMYVRMTVNIKGGSKPETVQLHREVVKINGKLPGYAVEHGAEAIVVDHKNRKTLDNRSCNLRTVTMLKNIRNSDRVLVGKSFRYRGISVAHINGKYYQAYSDGNYIGCLKCKKEIKVRIDRYLEGK